MTNTVLFVCKSCGFTFDEHKRNGITGGAFLTEKLQQAIDSWERKNELSLQTVSCLCVCDRPCAVAIANPDKPTFVLGNLSAEHIADDLLKMCELYLDSADGFVPRQDLPESLQNRRLARVPSPKI